MFLINISSGIGKYIQLFIMHEEKGNNVFILHVIFHYAKNSPLDWVLTALSRTFWTVSRKEVKTAVQDRRSVSSLALTPRSSSNTGRLD